MRPSTWQPPVETSAAEDKILKRVKRAKLFLCLRHYRHQLFTPELQAELASLYKDHPQGQPPVSPALLALALILQAYTGVSDAEVIEATLMDRRWQLVLDCLDAEEAPFSKGTYVAFRTRLIANQMDRRLLERTIERAKSSGAFGATNLRVALDSSPLWGAARVEDPWNLLGHALRKALGVIARQQGRELTAVAVDAGAELVAGSSLKAALDLDWDAPEARTPALTEVLGALDHTEAWLAAHLEVTEAESVATRVVAAMAAAPHVRTQDVTTTEAGQPALRKGVAADRRIAIEDAEMRHGRKSRTLRVDGYKRHGLRDLDTGLLPAVGLTLANAPEASVTDALQKDRDAQKLTLQQLHIDRAYLSSTMVKERGEAWESFCNAWPVRHGPYFPKTAVTLDWEQAVVRCPNQREAPLKLGRVVKCPAQACAVCPHQKQCTGSKNGRSRTLHTEEKFLQALRVRQSTSEGRAALRARVSVEHALAHMGHWQGDRARYFGKRKNLLDLRRCAVVHNLHIFARQPEMMAIAA